MRPRSIGPIAIAALALSAWLHARGVSALVGTTLGVPHAAMPVAMDIATPPALPRSADPILARNPFDSTTGPLLAAPEPAEAPEGDCPGVRVLAISVAEEPAWSLALLSFGSPHDALLRHPGGEILAIGAESVELVHDGVRCIARMFRGAAAPPVAASLPSPVASVRGVVATGPGSYVVDRAARDAILEGAPDWMRAVAVRPEKVGDDVVGLRIASLRPGTSLDALGIRAGDVLQSVDRIPLTSPERMLEAVTRSRTAEHLSVVLVRDGHPLQLDFEMR